MLAHRVLRGDAGRAVTSVTGLRLDAAEREHEAARAIAPVGTERHHARHVEGADHLAGATELDPMPQVRAQQRVVHQQQRLLQRHADMVDELHRRRAGAALRAIDDDEVGRDAGLHHRLDDAETTPTDARGRT